MELLIQNVIWGTFFRLWDQMKLQQFHIGWGHAQLQGANERLEQQPPPSPGAKTPWHGCGAS
jgi:hypothetical protein